jgi:hypothetical protein
MLSRYIFISASTMVFNSIALATKVLHTNSWRAYLERNSGNLVLMCCTYKTSQSIGVVSASGKSRSI